MLNNISPAPFPAASTNNLKYHTYGHRVETQVQMHTDKNDAHHNSERGFAIILVCDSQKLLTRKLQPL
jgi:hypothetical protein